MSLQTLLLKTASLINRISRRTGIARKPLSRLSFNLCMRAVDIQLHKDLSDKGLKPYPTACNKAGRCGCNCR